MSSPSSQLPTRTNSIFFSLGITITIAVFLAAMPGFVLVRAAGWQAEHGRTKVKLTQDQTHGRDLFAQSCAKCHALANNNSVGGIGPSFDQLKPPRALILNAIANGRSRGNGQMPAKLYVGKDAEAIANYLVAVAGKPVQ